jgi:hypothetical protein
VYQPQTHNEAGSARVGSTEETASGGLLSRSPDCVDLDCMTGASPRSPGGPCWPSRLNPKTQPPKPASQCFKPQAYARHTHAYARIFEKDALTMLRKQALSRRSRASAMPDCVTTEHGAAQEEHPPASPRSLPGLRTIPRKCRTRRPRGPTFEAHSSGPSWTLTILRSSLSGQGSAA